MHGSRTHGSERRAAALGGLAALVLAAIATTACPAAVALSVRETGPAPALVIPGDRVRIVYRPGTPGADTVGTLYVRNDRQRAFTRVQLARLHGQLVATVPGRLLRGQKLLYYAVFRARGKRGSVKVPARGAAGPERVWIAEQPLAIDLGAHAFGRVAKPEAVVAVARPEQVAFSDPLEGSRYGPWSFQVTEDGSVWLLDELDRTLLVWRAGSSDTIAQSLPVPERTVDFAVSPTGGVYVTRWLPPTMRLAQLTPAGAVGREIMLPTQAFNTLLRVGPDGTVYWVNPAADPSRRWVPAVTPTGRLLPVSEQLRRAGYEPVSRAHRLVTVFVSPSEIRLALVDARGRLARAWRVTSRTPLPDGVVSTPALVGGDLVVAVHAQSTDSRQIEDVVVRLRASGGTRARLSLRPAAFGDVITDLRIGPDGKLYQLASSPTKGVRIDRYSLAR